MQVQQQQIMSVVTVQSVPVPVVAQPPKEREWSSGLYGCCTDFGSCIYAGMCYPCFLCTLSSRMNECTCGPIWLHNCFLLGLRTKLRTKHKIQGTILDDCCKASFCGCCAAMQMHRELESIARQHDV